MAPARIYPWRRMRRSRVPSNGPGRSFVAPFSAGCTTNMSGFDFRQAQASPTSSEAQMCRPDRALLAPRPAHDYGLQHGFSRIRQVIFLPYWINIVEGGDVQFARVLHSKFAAGISN